MLGKLLKHEWKAVWKVPTLLIVVLMIMAVVSGLTFALPIWDSDWIGLPLSGMLLFLLFYVAMIAVVIGITIYFAVRYYKNMFTDEGYLTHTLPVTARQLLVNKVITMSAWNLIAVIAVALSLVVFGGVTVLSLAAKEGRFAFDILEAIEELKEIRDYPFFNGFQSFAVSGIVMILMSAVSGTMMVIGSITLGQMVRKHRILGSIGAYFAINTVTQVVSMVIIFPIMIKMVNDEEFLNNFEMSPFSFYTTTYTVMSVVFLAASVGLYFLSEYLLRKKLELE